MALSHYHRNYGKRLSSQQRADIKERELRQVFSAVNYTPQLTSLRVAILGCADKCHVEAHQQIFEKLLDRPVELTTFDITTEHLTGEDGVIKHDLTKPILGGPYDIAFGHVLLKFIETGNQWNVLQNSYDVLRSPGIAIHVFDDEDVNADTIKQPDGRYSVPLGKWEQKLTEAGIKHKTIRWSSAISDLPGIRGANGGALVLLR